MSTVERWQGQANDIHVDVYIVPAKSQDRSVVAFEDTQEPFSPEKQINWSASIRLHLIIISLDRLTVRSGSVLLVARLILDRSIAYIVPHPSQSAKTDPNLARTLDHSHGRRSPRPADNHPNDLNSDGQEQTSDIDGCQRTGVGGDRSSDNGDPTRQGIEPYRQVERLVVFPLCLLG